MILRSTHNLERIYLILSNIISKNIYYSTHYLDNQLETWALIVEIIDKIFQTWIYLIKNNIYNRTIF